MVLKNQKILLISPEAWGPNFLSKHHYAQYLSEKNTVYFLNPSGPWSLKNLFSPRVRLERISDTLQIVHFNNLLPRLSNLPAWLQAFVFKYQARLIRKKVHNRIDVVWSFDPFRYWDLNVWNAQKKIYHSVDIHFNCKHEHVAYQTADIVIGSAEAVLKPFRSYNSRISKVLHGADIRNFEKADSTRIELPGKNKIKAGYTGNFNKNIDYDLLYSVALENPNVDFIMIGPYQRSNLTSNERALATNEITRFQTLPNFYFLGPVPGSQLLNYILLFDVTIVVYTEEAQKICINPHKLMGYFYAGNVTVACKIDEYKNAPADLISMTSKNSDYPALFREVVQNLEKYNSPEKRALRRHFAEENSYDKHIEQIEKLLNT